MKYRNIFLQLIFASFLTQLSWALPPPKYLQVPHWQQCVKTEIKGSASFVCLPTKKPMKCKKTSWKLLNQRLLPVCGEK